MMTSIETITLILNILKENSIDHLEWIEENESIYIKSRTTKTKAKHLERVTHKEKSKCRKIIASQIGFFQPNKDARDNTFKFKPGDSIQKGNILGYIRCINILHQIKAPYDGILKNSLIKENQPIEYGQVLFEMDRIDQEIQHTQSK